MLSATLKGILQRHRLMAQLEALGPLPELPADFSQQREMVQASLVEHRLNVERAERELGRLEQRAAEIHPPADLLSVGKEAMTLLREAEEERAEADAGLQGVLESLGLDGIR